MYTKTSVYVHFSEEYCVKESNERKKQVIFNTKVIFMRAFYALVNYPLLSREEI